MGLSGGESMDIRPLPRCPNCGTELYKVVEENRVVYVFNEEEGRYVEDDGEAKMYCPECGEDLYDLFPDGVCNWRG